MELTGWSDGVVISAMCFLYVAGIFMGFVLAYLYMIFSGARTYIKSKRKMEEAFDNLEAYSESESGITLKTVGSHETNPFPKRKIKL